ncbi:LysM peptidoglycan-binding domain-containing protein [Kineococcus sp. R8]|nr:LysM peptidoglycan-binding domain-containing protein [Kineococcus siccus]
MRRPAPRRAGACPARRPLRLTRRGRLLVTTTAVAVLTSAVVAVTSAVGGGPAAAGTGAAPLVVVTVAPGQTLSEIAAQWAPGEDWRDVAVGIVEANHLPSQAVRAGQELVLPARR